MDKVILAGLEMKDGKIGSQVVMDLDNIGEFIEIPLIPNEKQEDKVNPDEAIRARMEECWYK